MSTRLLILLLVAILSGGLWRVELEMRWGWRDLGWVSGFHYSSWVVGVVFAGWLYFFVPCVPPKKPLLFSVSPEKSRLVRSLAALFGSAVGYGIYRAYFTVAYGWLFTPMVILVPLGVLIGLVIPFFICAVARHFSPAFPARNWLLVPLFFFLSFPFSSLLLAITDHPGGADPVHGVKSGFLLGSFVFAAGYAFLPGGAKARERGLASGVNA